MNETIPQLSISTLPNGNLRLEDASYSEGAIVDIHAIHVRLMAERLGLVATSDVQATRRIAALARRLRLLNHRINRLSDFLINHSDHEHADLDWEMTYCAATRDICDEFVADLDDEPATAPETPATPPATFTNRARTVITPPTALDAPGAQLEIPT